MKSNKPSQKPWPLILLLISIIVGGMLRFYKLGQVPVSLYWDEAAIGYDAYSLSMWGKDMHGNPGLQAIFPSYGDYKLPMYIWIDALVVKAFGPTPLAVRLPSAVAGLLLIVVMFFLTLELWHDPLLASIAALFQALLPIDILFSRTGFEGHLAVLWIALTLYLWLKSRKKPWLNLLAAITAAAAVYTYFSARVVVPLIALLTLLAFIKSTTRKWRIWFVASLGFWFLLLMPIYRSPYYAASNQFRLSTTNLAEAGPFAIQSNIDRQQSGNGPITRIIYYRYLLQAKAIMSHVTAHFDPRYLFLYGDTNLRHSTGEVGLMFFDWLPFIAIGSLLLLKKQSTVGCWLIGIWLASVIPAAIPMEIPHALRSMNADLVFPLLLTVGVGWLVQRHRTWIVFILALGTVIELSLFMHDYYVHYSSRSAADWQYGYSELAQNLQKQSNQFDSVTIDYPDNRLDLYFLFTDKIDPYIAATNSHAFQILSFNKYHFAEVNQLPTSDRDWVVLSKDKWLQLHSPPAIQLNDYQDKAEFYIIKGKTS